jgi:mannose/fructose/N-acetylgalactosamine-specific phosphotransferase system component IIC
MAWLGFDLVSYLGITMMAISLWKTILAITAIPNLKFTGAGSSSANKKPALPALGEVI